MKLCFQAGRSYNCNRMGRGDRLDQSVVYLLSTLPGEAFLVEKKGEKWKVTTGGVIVDTSVAVDISVPVKATITAKTKPKPKIVKFLGKPKTRKVRI